MISYYWEIHRKGFHVIDNMITSNTQRQSEGIVPRIQFLMEQAGHAICLRRKRKEQAGPHQNLSTKIWIKTSR